MSYFTKAMKEKIIKDAETWMSTLNKKAKDFDFNSDIFDFDKWFERITKTSEHKKITEEGFDIDYIVAGFNKNEITIEFEKQVLTINANNSTRTFSFEQAFDENVSVLGSKLENGILTIRFKVTEPVKKTSIKID